MSETLVLNKGYEPLMVIPSQRALVMVMQDKAENVLLYEDRFFKHPLAIQVPSIIRLVRRVNFYPKRARPTRKAVLLRDMWMCVYCGEHLYDDATIDHVIPKSRGGKNTWENLVSCCRDCNHKKADRTPEEAQMPLEHLAGFRPSMWTKSSEPEWEPFLKAWKRG